MATKPDPKSIRVRAKPTPEEIAKLREAREFKRKALAEAAQAEQNKLADYPHPLLALADNPHGRLCEREWVSLGVPSGDCHRVIVKTWNLLAQALIRRKLFPYSDCLKSAEREHMLFRELIYPRADVLCLQEVDRLDKIHPYLEAAGYSMIYASGPRKKHGCLIAFDRSQYEQIGEKVIHMDTVEIGASFKTKNIGSLVAIQSRKSDWGILVATTHLFWHPSYTYERTRQAGILLRATTQFRTELGKSWPCIIAGDFNFAPDDAAYALLVGMQLLPRHSGMLARSRVVHASLDPSVPITTRKMIGTTEDAGPSTAGKEGNDAARPIKEEDDEDEEGGTDPDRSITNAREAKPEDGLLNTSQLRHLFQEAGAPVRSMYDEAQRSANSAATCGPRLDLPPERLGSHEPEWTSYTQYWKTVLDYIFLLDPNERAKGQVIAYLKPPVTQDLDPGIPMKGVTSSDHVSLSVELTWPSA